MVAFASHSIYSKHYCFLFVMFLVVPLALTCAIGIIVNMIFSFVSVVKVVYRDYDMWNPDSINCASPAFFSAFTYITISLVPRPIPSFSMLHAEKREGLVSEVTCVT